MNKYNKLKHDNINKTSFIIAYSKNPGKLKQNFNCSNPKRKYSIIYFLKYPLSPTHNQYEFMHVL